MTDNSHLVSTVRHWLTAARLGPSGRLPPARDLAAQFCVSRAELRKVLSLLEAEGQIRRHVGRGTFLAKDPPAPGPADEDIAARTSPLAAMQARTIIEPELAGLAALNATGAQIAEMRSLCAGMRQAQSWEAYAELDWRFHNVIAEATGNVLLVEFQRLLNGVRRYVVWGNLLKRPEGPSGDYHSFEEHERVVDAIASRDPEGAIAAMRGHLGGTRSHMEDARAPAEVLRSA